MAKIEKFEDLVCWQKSRELVKAVYIMSMKGKLKTDFELRAQLRRAALSTMNNIAEGFSRFSKKEFIRFLDFSASSAGEVKSMLYVLEDLEYVTEEELSKVRLLTEETRNITLALLKYLVNRKT
jgi:four helix bundle protein